MKENNYRNRTDSQPRFLEDKVILARPSLSGFPDSCDEEVGEVAVLHRPGDVLIAVDGHRQSFTFNLDFYVKFNRLVLV